MVGIGDGEVCMRLVEYTKNGRIFRKWTYERCGDKSSSKKPPGCFSHRLLDEGLSDADDVDCVRISRRGGFALASPLSRRMKQERILKQERRLTERETEEQRRGSKEKDGGSKQDVTRSQDTSVEMKSAELKKRSKEKHDLQINERAALKEMSELYRDLLERFEELKQKQDSQIAAESDSTRLRLLAEKDPSITKLMRELVDTVKNAACNFKTCAMLAGSSMPNAQHHERELDHIILELECAAVLK